MLLDVTPTRNMVEEWGAEKVPDIGYLSTSTPCKDGVVGDRGRSTAPRNALFKLALMRNVVPFVGQRMPAVNDVPESHPCDDDEGVDRQTYNHVPQPTPGCQEGEELRTPNVTPEPPVGL